LPAGASALLPTCGTIWNPSENITIPSVTRQENLCSKLFNDSRMDSKMISEIITHKTKENKIKQNEITFRESQFIIIDDKGDLPRQKPLQIHRKRVTPLMQ
jgi:hypothetical protein